MARSDFLARIAGARPADTLDYIYYTGDLGTKSLLKDVQPIEELVMADGNGNSQPSRTAAHC